MEVVVEDKQLSLAIGKKGQNVRLAAKLTGWRIDIKSEEEKRREVEAQFGALEAGERSPRPKAPQSGRRADGGRRRRGATVDGETDGALAPRSRRRGDDAARRALERRRPSGGERRRGRGEAADAVTRRAQRRPTADVQQ